jgi:hypothetical protein
MSKIADLLAAVALSAAMLGIVISVGMLAVAAIGALLTRRQNPARGSY